MNQNSITQSKHTTALSSEAERALALEKQKADSYNKQKGDLEGYDCPKCLNKGTIAYVDGKTRKMHTHDCDCMALRNRPYELSDSELFFLENDWHMSLEYSGLNGLIGRFRFENFQVPELWQKRFLEAAKDYAFDPRGRWFLAAGVPGSGKSHICTATAHELTLPPSYRSLRYLLWVEESRKLKALRYDNAAYQEEIEKFKFCDVLYIDDFFKVKQGESVSTADVNLAFELLSSRYNDPEKLTLISTEWYMEDLLALDEALGSRIWDRCKDGCAVSLRGKEKNWRMRED